MPFSEARWIDVLPRSAACPQLASQVLLHAGPPFRGAPPTPVVNAAVQAMLFENLAVDAAEARDLLARGGVELRPAQDYRIATPLAQVVSASMLLFAVQQHNEICCAPLIEGSAPALRFGSPAPASLQRLRELGAWVNSRVAPLVRERPVQIAGLISAAVAGGDECHARTAVANEALMSSMGLGPPDSARLRAIPAFVLPLLMAAACAALRTRRCDIEAIGGNGLEFGVRWRGDHAWRRTTAEPPRGLPFAGVGVGVGVGVGAGAGAGAGATPLGAIGDSAVIDFCGLGGQALSAAPLLASEWSAILPADALLRRERVIDPDTGIVDAGRVVRSGIAPLINLGVIDRDGAAGLIGRGFYSPLVDLFWVPEHFRGQTSSPGQSDS
jgi:hypothetical protein